MNTTEFALWSLLAVAAWCFYEGIARPSITGKLDEFFEDAEEEQDDER